MCLLFKQRFQILCLIFGFIIIAFSGTLANAEDSHSQYLERPLDIQSSQAKTQDRDPHFDSFVAKYLVLNETESRRRKINKEIGRASLLDDILESFGRRFFDYAKPVIDDIGRFLQKIIKREYSPYVLIPLFLLLSIILAPLFIARWLHGLIEAKISKIEISIYNIPKKLDLSEPYGFYHCYYGVIAFPEKVYENDAYGLSVNFQKSIRVPAILRPSALAADEREKIVFVYHMENEKIENFNKNIEVELFASPNVTIEGQKSQIQAPNKNGFSYIWNCAFPVSSTLEMRLRFNYLDSIKKDNPESCISQSSQIGELARKVKVAHVLNFSKSQVRNLKYIFCFLSPLLGCLTISSRKEIFGLFMDWLSKLLAS